MSTTSSQCDLVGQPHDVTQQDQELFMKEALLMVLLCPFFLIYL